MDRAGNYVDYDFPGCKAPRLCGLSHARLGTDAQFLGELGLSRKGRVVQPVR